MLHFETKKIWYFFNNNVLVMCLWILTVCELLDPYKKELINCLCWGVMMNYNQFLPCFRFNSLPDLASLLIRRIKSILGNFFLSCTRNRLS
jgi:hypothetical protein